MENQLTKEETDRYSRQLLLPEIGVAGQLKLKQSNVLVVGAGGLGVPVLQYLAAAGVGKIGIVDGDVIELSNLQRQVIYSISDIGKPKAVVAKEKLLQINSDILIHCYPEFFSSKNSEQILADYDIVIDGTDNFKSHYLINDACVKMNKPLISGAVSQFTGQLGVFNFNNSGTYRCLFPLPPQADALPDCNEAGVMGIVPGLIGMMMANEVIKIICGTGDVLAGKFMTVDLLRNKFQAVSFVRDDEAVNQIKLNALIEIDKNEVCRSQPVSGVKEILPEQLKEMITQHNSFQLIDVREPFERIEANIGGDLIPFDEVMRNEKIISREQKVIFYCRIGARSHIIIQRLQDKFGFTNLYNLKGGIERYLSGTISSSVK